MISTGLKSLAPHPFQPKTLSHRATTQVIALENTLGGTIFPQEDIIAISNFAKGLDIKLHLDGTRLWHVAIEKAVTLQELCEPFDSVSMCFSKGLGIRTSPGRSNK